MAAQGKAKRTGGLPHLEALRQELERIRDAPPEVGQLLRQRDGSTAQAVLRQALRHSLDMEVKPVIRHEDGSQQAMTRDDMINVYSRRREHMLAYHEMLQWAIVEVTKASWTPTAACCHDICTTPAVAYAFWHSADGAPKRLPRAFAEGLDSCVHLSGLSTVLLTYQLDLEGVPAGVHVRNAGRVLPWAVFAKLLHGRRVRVQHLSDYIRCLALIGGVDPSSCGGGWLVDGDTIWFRPAPVLSVARPPNLGHWFGCCQAAKSIRIGGVFWDKARVSHYWGHNYLKTPSDFLHIGFPMAAPGNSPILARWRSLMEKELFGGLSPGIQQAACPQRYNLFMTALQRVVRECGMEAAIAPARTCAPWDRLKAAHAGDSAKRHLFNADALAGALCINSIWQSSIATQDGTQAHAAADKQHDANSAWRLVSDLWRANVVPFKRQRQKGKPVPRVQGLACNTVEVATQTDPSTSSATRAELMESGGVPQSSIATQTDPSTSSATSTELMEPCGMPQSSTAVGSHDAHRHAGARRVVTSDACVGESVRGDPFAWKTSFDM